MPAKVTLQLARTRQQFEQALQLLQISRERWGLESPAVNPHKLWLLKQHALPSTNTIVALCNGEVVGSICLFGDSSFKLPSEARLNLRSFRDNLQGRLAELSLPAIHSDFSSKADLLHALYHFALSFGTSFCKYDGFVTEASEAWAFEYARHLHFDSIFEPNEGRQMLFLNAREGADYRSSIGRDFTVDFRFPDRRYFFVAQQCLSPEVFNYLFNECSRLFADMSAADLRTLRNIFDYGEYRKFLPEKGGSTSDNKSPQSPRFPMNCEGYLINKEGGREHLQVIDVSREGVKIRVPLRLQRGNSHVFTLFVGVNRKTELIGKVAWADKASGIAGVEVHSSDEVWRQLIDYLEKDYSVAA